MSDSGEAEHLPEVPAGDSSVQQHAEAVLLAALAERLGVRLVPSRLHLPDGSYVDVDGVSLDPAFLVEAWAHQGPPKGAQRNKVLTDALKLAHVAGVLTDRPWRKILLFSDDDAARPFTSGSWYAGALRTLNVEVEVVTLEPALRASILDAQKRQYR